MKVTAIKKRSDVLWSKIIRSIGYCERCKKKTNLNAHHIVGRAGIALRYDLENGVCLCVGCHYWAHNKPTAFTYWLEEYIGRDVIEGLHAKDKPTYGKYDYTGNYEYLLDLSSRL